MKLAKQIARGVWQYQLDRMGKCVCADELEPVIEAKLKPVKDAAEKIKTCAGYAKRECLTCDEGGACMIDLLSAIAMLSEEGK